MTSKPGTSLSLFPFLFQFAQPLPEVADRLLRYDPERQISEILADDGLQESLDAQRWCERATRFTEVRTETIDDE